MELRQAVQALDAGRRCVGGSHCGGGVYADLLHLAKLYDYVVREFDPPRRARAGAPPPQDGANASAVGAPPPLAAPAPGGGRGRRGLRGKGRGGRGGRGTAIECRRGGRCTVLPRCVRDQRDLRRAIERHAHFDEIHYWWQQHHWTGDGYCAWPTLPGEPLLQGST